MQKTALTAKNSFSSAQLWLSASCSTDVTSCSEWWRWTTDITLSSKWSRWVVLSSKPLLHVSSRPSRSTNVHVASRRKAALDMTRYRHDTGNCCADISIKLSNHKAQLPRAFSKAVTYALRRVYSGFSLPALANGSSLSNSCHVTKADCSIRRGQWGVLSETSEGTTVWGSGVDLLRDSSSCFRAAWHVVCSRLARCEVRSSQSRPRLLRHSMCTLSQTEPSASTKQQQFSNTFL